MVSGTWSGFSFFFVINSLNYLWAFVVPYDFYDHHILFFLKEEFKICFWSFVLLFIRQTLRELPPGSRHCFRCWKSGGNDPDSPCLLSLRHGSGQSTGAPHSMSITWTAMCDSGRNKAGEPAWEAVWPPGRAQHHVAADEAPPGQRPAPRTRPAATRRSQQVRS